MAFVYMQTSILVVICWIEIRILIVVHVSLLMEEKKSLTVLSASPFEHKNGLWSSESA